MKKESVLIAIFFTKLMIKILKRESFMIET